MGSPGSLSSLVEGSHLAHITFEVVSFLPARQPEWIPDCEADQVGLAAADVAIPVIPVSMKSHGVCFGLVSPASQLNHLGPSMCGETQVRELKLHVMSNTGHVTCSRVQCTVA